MSKKSNIFTQKCRFIKIDNSDFWVDEIQWNGQVQCIQKQIGSKDSKMLDDHQNVFCLFCELSEDQLHFQIVA